jgi:hypothetical protein
VARRPGKTWADYRFCREQQGNRQKESGVDGEISKERNGNPSPSQVSLQSRQQKQWHPRDADGKKRPAHNQRRISPYKSDPLLDLVGGPTFCKSEIAIRRFNTSHH